MRYLLLQDSFAQHSEQQAALAQNLVGKVKQLQEANISIAACDQKESLQQSSTSHVRNQADAVYLVQDLSTQLLSLVSHFLYQLNITHSVYPFGCAAGHHKQPSAVFPVDREE